MQLYSFVRAASSNLQMLIKIATNDFCVPQFSHFQTIIRELYDFCAPNSEGHNASYIPQLAAVDPSKWAISVCTIDGQKFNIGDVDALFTMQSTSKPLTYALAITEHGPDKVHDYVGYEPSGRKFNLVILNDNNKPHNPLINSGAIAVTALMKNGSCMPERFMYINKELSRMAGGVNLGFNNPVYLSERSSADRNFSLAYYMREHKCFPPGTDLHETLDLYFQICSIETDSKAMATIAATMANGGVNPITGERILSGPAVRDTLSVMHSCGMYDYSGQFAFKVGLPAKSGVSGAIMLVVPNLMGIAIYSPRLDEQGNSVRGIQFCQELVKRFVFHNYDSLLHSSAKLDPRKHLHEDRVQSVVRLLFAAKNNDLNELRRCLIANVDFNTTDYDDRTGLHVAASAGAFDAVRFFIEVAHVDPNPLDRWHIKKGEISPSVEDKSLPKFNSFDADTVRSPNKLRDFVKKEKKEDPETAMN
ncbi:hypothetical protein Ciccas_008182 [Cichlidogyrus casuarinus]|uniref:glutaminase n=1 Tax=Cichlidogyrus casuarinus TaxID=1844966 RepID=A0ABD2Q0P6_9PLAT